MALERDRLPQACRGRWAPAPERGGTNHGAYLALGLVRSTPARGGQLGCRLGRETARQAKGHNIGSSYSARNRFTGVVRTLDNDGVMAWVEIEPDRS